MATAVAMPKHMGHTQSGSGEASKAEDYIAERKKDLILEHI